MNTLAVAVLSFFGFIVAYHTYGRWLARKIFRLDPEASIPSRELNDGVDYVPSRREVVFGHHFTSIAGTGPIVGPAIAVFWGWLPALLWVVFGAIFIGAVHDFGALVVSLRNRGQSIGEVAGRMINPRAKALLLIVLFLSLTIVLAIFGLVIAIIFAKYPQSVLSVWIEIPLAIAIGFWVYKRSGGLLWPSILALGLMYLAIGVGAYWLPIKILPMLGLEGTTGLLGNKIVVWTGILFVYCFIASVLPVWVLLQPRDYINSHQLMLALGLLVLGLAVAGFSGEADLVSSAPAIASDIPFDAPPIWPFLFITVACGAISGFHSLVSSGTTSKQMSTETDAQAVGYGGMLLEGVLAVIVILACCAGLGMGVKDPITGKEKTGLAAWQTRYQPREEVVVRKDGAKVKVGGWRNHRLPQKVGAFVDGGANFMKSLGIPLPFAIGIVAVLVASFAATTLDTATRLQRYVIQEISHGLGLKPLTNKYAATAAALIVAGIVALLPGPGGTPGTGGLILWPMFGATNQLLAGLAFMVLVFYLLRTNRPVWFVVIPMVVMLVLPAWAMLWQMFNPETGWLPNGKYLLFGFGLAIQVLELWLIAECVLMWKRARGVYPALPPLPTSVGASCTAPATEGGRTC